MEHVRQTLGISERRACRVLGQHRSTQRKPPQGREDEARLTADVIELAREYGRYGYRRVAVLLRRAGWQVNHKRVARIWRREGLKVPHKQKKRGRLWLNDGSCVRLKPEHPILHSLEYKDRFAADLKKMVPRIPFAADFRAFSNAGRELGQWHLNYETVEPYPLEEETGC